MTVKAITYAYATSKNATRLGAGETGCYCVELHPSSSDARLTGLRGPFATIEDAERHALAIQCDWSRWTKRADAANETWRA